MSNEAAVNIGAQMQQFGRDHGIPGDAASREPTPLMYVMQHMVPPVLGLVALKHQGKAETLFRDNPTPVWCFLAAICVYWTIVGLMKQLTSLWLEIASRIALASGVLSAISLLSMFLPHPLSLVPVMIWIPVPIVLAWPIRYQA